jgi:osmoprotectant transport system ATP-binding protein
MQLELAGVSKRYGATTALGGQSGQNGQSGIDLMLPAARTSALIGPSGCGKSTVLRLLVGLLEPDAGEIRFDAAPMRGLDLVALRRRIGYVIQEGGLFPHLTAGENVALMARHLGWDRARTGARLDELVALARFPPEALARYPTELSGGQRQRVSLMRALLLDPDVVLLDEPLGALDPLGRAELRDDLRRIFRALGKTVVLVTHDVAEAAFLADLVVVMRAGAIVQRGPFAELRAAPADPFVTAFLTAGEVPA